MGISVSSALSTATLAVANASANSPAPQKVQQPPPQQTTGDTVTLTEAQQVYQLYNQGQSVPQIATSLSLTVSVVNNYLGITTSSS
jgi:DNA-binding NarL/FixJ family response regulator